MNCIPQMESTLKVHHNQKRYSFINMEIFSFDLTQITIQSNVQQNLIKSKIQGIANYLYREIMMDNK